MHDLFQVRYRYTCAQVGLNERVRLDDETTFTVQRVRGSDAIACVGQTIFARSNLMLPLRFTLEAFEEYQFTWKGHNGTARRVLPAQNWVLLTNQLPTPPDTRFRVVPTGRWVTLDYWVSTVWELHMWARPADWPDLYIRDLRGRHEITLMSPATAPFANRLLTWLRSHGIEGSNDIVIRADKHFRWHLPEDMVILSPYFVIPVPTIMRMHFKRDTYVNERKITADHIPLNNDTIGEWMKCRHYLTREKCNFWRMECAHYAALLFARTRTTSSRRHKKSKLQSWTRLPVEVQVSVFRYVAPFAFFDEELQQLMKGIPVKLT